VATAKEEGLLSTPDTVIARQAAAEGRMVYTLDVEFADARRFPPGSHPGIVLFRPASLGPLAVNALVTWFSQEINLNDVAGSLIVVEPGQVRIRRPISEPRL